MQLHAGPVQEIEYQVCDHSNYSYYYAGGQAVALRRDYPVISDTAPGEGEFYVYTSTLYYLHHDRLGSLTEVTDESGELVGSARYDAFGKIVENTIPLTVTDRLYAYSIYDPDTGLYKIGARWYDPVVGVWLTPDSIVPDVNNPIAWNPYAFNYQNPANYVDPSGHFVESALDAIGLGMSWRDFWRKPSWGNAFWLGLDVVGLALPFVAGSWIRHAGKADEIGDAGRVVMELGPGTGDNLLNIAESRPGWRVIGIDYDPELGLFRRRLQKSPHGHRIEMITGDYLDASLNVPLADEVIAVAPGPSALEGGASAAFAFDAAEGAAMRVSRRGQIYVVSDLIRSEDVANQVAQYAVGKLGERGIKPGAVLVNKISASRLATGRNPLGIPLQSPHLTSNHWSIYIDLR